MGEKIQKLKKIKKIKKIRIHREGTDTLIYSAMVLIAVGVIATFRSMRLLLSSVFYGVLYLISSAVLYVFMVLTTLIILSSLQPMVMWWS